MAEHDAEDMSFTVDTLMILAARPRAVIHLHFVSRFDLDPAERQLRALAQLVDEATHGTVLTGKAVFLLQVLEDALGRQALLQLIDDQLTKVLAVTPRRSCDAGRPVVRRPGGRFGLLCVRRPGGRFPGGRFGIL